MFCLRKQRLLLALVLFFNSIQFATAQENWGAMYHVIPVKGYEGHHFRLQASVKCMVEDDSASARLWVRVDKKSGIGFFENMWKHPIRNSEWKTYTIEGTIDTAATRLVIGALCELNGQFSYDNFKVEVESDNKKWQTVYTDDFEKGMDGWLPGIGFGPTGANSLYTGAVQHEQTGNNSALVINGVGVPNWGANKKAGNFANVNGIKLYYEIYGEGQPLVVLHGNGGSIADAGSHYSELVKKYKVIAIDSRSQGRSTDTNQPLTYD